MMTHEYLPQTLSNDTGMLGCSLLLWLKFGLFQKSVKMGLSAIHCLFSVYLAEGTHTQSVWHETN